MRPLGSAFGERRASGARGRVSRVFELAGTISVDEQAHEVARLEAYFAGDFVKEFGTVLAPSRKTMDRSSSKVGKCFRMNKAVTVGA
jgi:hypothetical protein